MTTFSEGINARALPARPEVVPRGNRELAFNLVRWSALRTGGHFAPLAAHEACTVDVIASTDQLKAGAYAS